MMIIIPLIYLIGYFMCKFFVKVYSKYDNLQIIKSSIYWIVYLIITMIAVVLYYSNIEINSIMEALTNKNLLYLAASTIFIIAICELLSPVNSILKRKMKNHGIDVNEEVDLKILNFLDDEYNLHIKLITQVIIMCIVGIAPIYVSMLLLEKFFSFFEMGNALLSDALGISITILLPIFIRQVVYCFSKIKKISIDHAILVERSRAAEINHFLRKNNRKL